MENLSTFERFVLSAFYSGSDTVDLAKALDKPEWEAWRILRAAKDKMRADPIGCEINLGINPAQ